MYLEEQEKKASLDRELEELRYNLELEMESASRERDAMKIREGIFILDYSFLHFYFGLQFFAFHI